MFIYTYSSATMAGRQTIYVWT